MCNTPQSKDCGYSRRPFPFPCEPGNGNPSLILSLSHCICWPSSEEMPALSAMTAMEFRVGAGLGHASSMTAPPAASYRENGYIAQPIPTPISKKRNSDQMMYFTRSLARRRLKKPNATEIRSANSVMA